MVKKLKSKCKVTTEITIKPWAGFVVWTSVFLGVYPPKWVFSVKTVDVKQ